MEARRFQRAEKVQEEHTNIYTKIQIAQKSTLYLIM